MKMIYRFVAALTFSIASLNVCAQGIPVYDGANFANMLQQLAAWQQQLQAMQQQYNQLQSQYQAVTGARGYGNLLTNPNLQQYLPSNLQNVYQQMASGNLTSGAQALRNQNRIYDCQGMTGAGYTSCQANLSKNYQDQDLFTQAYQSAVLQDQVLMQLQQQINTTQDPKAIAELQARIATEQANQQNAMLKAQLAMQLAEIQNKIASQQAVEAYRKATAATKK